MISIRRSADDAVELGQDIRTHEGLDIRRIVTERPEHETVQGRGAQLARAVLLDAEIGRHAAPAVHPALEGDRFQIAPQIVAPGVIDALEILGAAAGIVEADQRAAMDAAVLERGDRTVGVAHDHDRHLSDLCRAPVAGIGDLRLPGRGNSRPGLRRPAPVRSSATPGRDRPSTEPASGRRSRPDAATAGIQEDWNPAWHIHPTIAPLGPCCGLSQAGILTFVARGSQALTTPRPRGSCDPVRGVYPFRDGRITMEPRRR